MPSFDPHFDRSELLPQLSYATDMFLQKSGCTSHLTLFGERSSSLFKYAQVIFRDSASNRETQRFATSAKRSKRSRRAKLKICQFDDGTYGDHLGIFGCFFHVIFERSADSQIQGLILELAPYPGHHNSRRVVGILYCK